MSVCCVCRTVRLDYLYSYGFELAYVRTYDGRSSTTEWFVLGMHWGVWRARVDTSCACTPSCVDRCPVCRVRGDRCPVCRLLTGARTMSASSSKRKAVVGSGGPSTKKTSGTLSPAGAGAGTAANSKSSTRSYYMRTYVHVRTHVRCV